MYKNRVILLLGSNLGEREKFLHEANKLVSEFSIILKKTQIKETEPWGYTSENKFLNQAILIETNLSPISLLTKIKKIEFLLGRKKSDSQGYKDRTIDIDIVEFNTLTYISSKLVLPHKNHLMIREFSQNLIFSLKNG